jgi:NMD protein affecting ribosome stability and mRNA decay
VSKCVNCGRENRNGCDVCDDCRAAREAVQQADQEREDEYERMLYEEALAEEEQAA